MEEDTKGPRRSRRKSEAKPRTEVELPSDYSGEELSSSDEDEEEDYQVSDEDME